MPLLWVTLSSPRVLGRVRDGFGLLLFHVSYWGSFGHLIFLLVFLSPLCFLLVCLMAPVPRGCPCLVWAAHRVSPPGMELCPRVHLQLRFSTAVSPSVCPPKSVPCVCPACNGCCSSKAWLSRAAVGSPSRWVMVTHAGLRGGWTRLPLASSPQVPTTALLLEPWCGETYLK